MNVLDECYVLHEEKSGTWWGPNRGGYARLFGAGVYSREQAAEIQDFSDRYGRKDRMMTLREAIAYQVGEPPREGTVAALLLSQLTEAQRADASQ